MNNNNPIGLVDSGVGGLTVVKQAINRIPNEQFIFIGDTQRMPYGPKSVEEVISYTFQMANFLIEQKKIKLLVIACNTATARALDKLQQQLPIPVIGVIQAGAVAAQHATKNHLIGIIATEGTVQSNAYPNALKQIDINVETFQQAEPEFVQIVESNQYHSLTAKQIVAAHLANFKVQEIDTLVLGCTHFPLLSSFIKDAVGNHVKLVDSGFETVQIIEQTLIDQNLSSFVKHDRSEDIFYTTADPDRFDVIATDWLAPEMPLDVRHLKIIGSGSMQYLQE